MLHEWLYCIYLLLKAGKLLLLFAPRPWRYFQISSTRCLESRVSSWTLTPTDSEPRKPIGTHGMAVEPRSPDCEHIQLLRIILKRMTSVGIKRIKSQDSLQSHVNAEGFWIFLAYAIFKPKCNAIEKWGAKWKILIAQPGIWPLSNPTNLAYILDVIQAEKSNCCVCWIGYYRRPPAAMLLSPLHLRWCLFRCFFLVFSRIPVNGRQFSQCTNRIQQTIWFSVTMSAWYWNPPVLASPCHPLPSWT